MMQKLPYPHPHWGWKVYFVLWLGFTLYGLTVMQIGAMELINTIVGVVGLVGLFGYAWSVRVPGAQRFWLGVGIVLVMLAVISIGIMLWRSREIMVRNPVAAGVAAVVTGLLLIPNIVAVLRYSRRLRPPI
jgi:hypothetical protein